MTTATFIIVALLLVLELLGYAGWSNRHLREETARRIAAELHRLQREES
jgi:hypothetical protein